MATQRTVTNLVRLPAQENIEMGGEKKKVKEKYSLQVYLFCSDTWGKRRNGEGKNGYIHSHQKVQEHSKVKLEG